MTDTLEIGGAERMAVNIVNRIPRSHIVPHLCTTRRSGPLASLIAADVGQLHLNRQHRLDMRAVRRLVAYIRDHDIEVLHAHGTALFTAVMASLFSPHPIVVWHIHFGRYAADWSPGRLYRLIGRRVRQTIAVSQPLAAWARGRLRMPAERVLYIPNFSAGAPDAGRDVSLPGTPGRRIVCVANFLPEKDHQTLLRAMELVVRERPDAHLLLVGGAKDPAHEQAIRRQICDVELAANVTLLGQRQDVPLVLRYCDIGVLSSIAEGLPLALIEYGEAGLPTVTTHVGQCADVVGDGKAGIVVPPRQPEALAEAILSLLESAERRAAFGRALYCRVQNQFSADRVVGQICAVYDAVAR